MTWSKRAVGSACILLVITAMSLVSPGPHVDAAVSDTGIVIHVEDGDTFTVRYATGQEERIRVAGINTNETNRSPVCYAIEATDRLDELIAGRTVTMTARDATSTAEGRPIRHVTIDGVNVAALMLREGYGVPLIFMNEPDHADAYLRAYWRAFEDGAGIHDPDRCGSGYAVPDLDMTVSSDATGSDFENVNGEWVLFRNRGTSAIDLTGWQLHDTALEYYAFPSGTVLAPGGWLKIHVGVGTDTTSHLYMGRTYPIFSGADGVFLLDPVGNIRLQSLWPCIGLCGDEPVAELEITEVQYDVPGTDAANDEWVVITNRGRSTVDLLDWSIHTYPYNVYVSRSTPIPPGGAVTAYMGIGSDTASRVYLQNTQSVLGSEGDLVLLANPVGDVVSCVAWGTSSCDRHPPKGPQSQVGADFDGNGWGDVLVGVPGEDVGTLSNAGSVNVEYGPGGIVENEGGNNWQVAGPFSDGWSQAGDIAGAAESDDRFGSSVAVGDFDADGYDDAAIGVPGEDLYGAEDGGAVNVLFGGRFGLSAGGSVIFSQSGPIAGAPESDDGFGSALAVGDFDGDGFDDLAIGVPGENSSSGIVQVLYGTASGLSPDRHTTWGQEGVIPGAAEPGDRFGATLAAGDFDGDGHDDLAIGVPGEDAGAGAVVTVAGSSSGLRADRSSLWGQWGSWPGASEPGDTFGGSLAVGDLDRDGFDDLAIGSPGESMFGRVGVGAVHVVAGTAGGLDASTARSFTQSGVLGGSAEAGDRLGAAVAIADLDDDAGSELVVGVPGEALGSTAEAGIVHVVHDPFGSVSVATFSQTGPIIGASEAGDRFGETLGVVVTATSRRAGLVVGIPGEDVGNLVDAGSAVIVGLDGSGMSVERSDGLTQWGARSGAGEPGDAYGAAVGAAD